MKTIGSHGIGILLCFLLITAGSKAQTMRSVSLIQASTPTYPPCSLQRESPSPSVFTKNNYRTASTIGETTSGRMLHDMVGPISSPSVGPTLLAQLMAMVMEFVLSTPITIMQK